ncbi:hypothetical protein ACFYVL_02815 [Streptomyces sp. NPDC004111]|uniref:hypothetical protein n=1 Tax=Streptomyces sp. NPDC004111 TaxID=3364690 RepID=UPI00369CE9D2
MTGFDVGQFFDRDVLRWGTEGSCAGCPNAWCETGSGVTPQHVRQALLRAYGPARLRPDAEVPTLVPVMRALRTGLGLSLGEARARAVELVGTGLVGTLVEMEVLAVRLRSQGVAVRVETGA